MFLEESANSFATRKVRVSSEVSARVVPAPGHFDMRDTHLKTTLRIKRNSFQYKACQGKGENMNEKEMYEPGRLMSEDRTNPMVSRGYSCVAFGNPQTLRPLLLIVDFVW